MQESLGKLLGKPPNVTSVTLPLQLKVSVPNLRRVFLGVKLSLIVVLRRGDSRLGSSKGLVRSTLSSIKGKACLSMSEENSKMPIVNELMKYLTWTIMLILKCLETWSICIVQIRII